jgi:hypothetical protein
MIDIPTPRKSGSVDQGGHQNYRCVLKDMRSGMAAAASTMIGQ